MKLLAGLVVIVGGLGLALGIALLYSVFVWLLWNNVLIDVFPAINSIGLWQALGLTVLCSLLFKSGNTSSSK